MTSTLLEAIDIRKQFGTVKALQGVSLKLQEGSVHALLGENGAGKSTLVKCIMGYYRPDQGQLLFRNKQVSIDSPQEAGRLGLGMVYQHFTLIDNMTIAENIVLSRLHLPAIIDWKQEKKILQAKMAEMPFQFDINRPVNELSIGEKQKVEITKQLLLQSRILILDEPTSVLTPTEADEVLDKIHGMTRSGQLTVLIITHKFREVTRYADQVTVLRKGAFVGTTPVADTSPAQLADMMVGGERLRRPPERQAVAASDQRLKIRQLTVENDQALHVIRQLDLTVNGGEIVGIAGVSGNGQKQLVEVLGGQRQPVAGDILVNGEPYTGTRQAMRRHQLYCLPEEPLRNACVSNLSVADNLVLRTFDQPPYSWQRLLLNQSAIHRNARQMIEQFGIRTSGPAQPIQALSGGNVQRAVLARELAQRAAILVVSNPCFGLDFKAVADIHAQLLAARNAGTAVLLLSEDLDEILTLSDRFFVISGGKLVYETTAAAADLNRIGQTMAGH